MKQPILTSLNFKRSSDDQDGQSPSTLEKNIDACSPSIPYKRGPYCPPPFKRKTFPSLWFRQFDLLGFDENRGTKHLIVFHFNETID